MNKIHIVLEKDQKLWFTSDLHFGHNNICKPTFANRPWKDAKEMGPALIANWNEVVGDNDIAFILGDVFWFNDSQSIKRVLSQLKGKDIYIIAGNHDDFTSYHRVTDTRIHLLGDEAIVWVNNFYEDKPSKVLELYLSHCPMGTWPHRANGVPNLFGHVHSGPRVNSSNSDADFGRKEGEQYDVGTDNNNYYPVEIGVVLDKLVWEKKQNERFHFGFDNQGPYCLECGSRDVSYNVGMYVNHYWCNECKVDSIG